MPRPGELQAGLCQRVSIVRNGHFVVQPPAPSAFPIETIVNQALNDLAKCPKLLRNRIPKRVVPLRPRIFLADSRRGLQEHSPRGEGCSDLRPQLLSERRNRPFDVEFSPVYVFGSEELRESLENVLTDHGFGPPHLFRVSAPSAHAKRSEGSAAH